MNRKILKPIIIASAVVVLSACSATVPRYNSSADNVSSLRSLDTAINVGTITATTYEKSIMCRLANPVDIPDGKTVNEYIENALIEELKMAGKYDKTSSITISGNLNETSASSGMTDGHWIFDMTVISGNGKSFDVISKHEYSGSFVGEVACRENMPDEFKPAVQKLIMKIITDPRFKSLLS